MKGIVCLFLRSGLASLMSGLLLLAVSSNTALARVSTMPPGMVVPVRVHLSVRILDVVKISEVAGETSASLEFTAVWNDPSQAFDPVVLGSNRKDFAGPEAEDMLQRIWTPDIAIENQIGSARTGISAVSIFSNGDVALLRRIDGDFRIVNDLSAFPFDRQELRFPFTSQSHAVDDLIFVVDDRDRELSSLSSHLTASDWSTRSLQFSMERYYGWNARPFMRVNVTAVVARNWPRYFLRIFVPFAAVLTVSLFLLWAPRPSVRDAVGITYSALLALAALSFTFESSFPGSMSVNSPTALMISLGYFYLILTLLVDMMLESGFIPGNRTYPFLAQEMRRHLRYVLPGAFAVVCTCTVLRSLS